MLSLQKSSVNMKLKFTLRYRTAWGESLHVAIAFHSQDGMVRQQNLLMQTEDGELWTLDTAALIGRQHTLSHIVYRYQVENAKIKCCGRNGIWCLASTISIRQRTIFSQTNGATGLCLTIFIAMLI